MYICVKSIRIKQVTKIKNIGLFFGIIACNLASGLLYMSVFRYLVVVALYFGLLKFLYKNSTKFYDVFAINVFLFIKLFCEYITFLAFDYTILNAVICLSAFCVIPLVFQKQILKKYILLSDLWNHRLTFYLRYSLIVVSIASILIYSQILISIMKVR
jgi:hypothetical protein